MENEYLHPQLKTRKAFGVLHNLLENCSLKTHPSKSPAKWYCERDPGISSGVRFSLSYYENIKQKVSHKSSVRRGKIALSLMYQPDISGH